jgi:hypothetical protein
MSVSSQGKCSFLPMQHDTNMLKAASQSEAGDIIASNTSSDTPKPSTIIHEYNMTPPTTAHDSDSGNETDLEHEPQDENKEPPLNTLLVTREKRCYGTMCYLRGEINWVNLVNKDRVIVSDLLQDSFQDLGLAMEKAPGAVLELEAGLKTKRGEAVEVFLRLLRWSLNDKFKHRAEN